MKPKLQIKYVSDYYDCELPSKNKIVPIEQLISSDKDKLKLLIKASQPS